MLKNKKVVKKKTKTCRIPEKFIVVILNNKTMKFDIIEFNERKEAFDFHHHVIHCHGDRAYIYERK